MSFELVITYITLGAYLFFCLESSVKMFCRILFFEDYSPWQKGLYALFGILMFFISLQLIWDANVYYFPSLSWTEGPHLIVQDITLMSVPLCGLILWTLTTHKLVSFTLALKHLLPFAGIITCCCVFRDIMPWFVIVLYAYVVVYCIYLLVMSLQNYHAYNLRLQQTYADTKYRTLTWMIHLVWLFGFILVLFIYFAYVQMEQDYIYYGIVCGIWYYMGWNISHVRETKALDVQFEEEEQEAIRASLEQEELEQKSPEERERLVNARLSLRELTKQRLEETLEETCMSRRLYLNPDLTVNDLANELSTNRTYISQYFSEHHTTFLKFINDLRVEYAMFQLKNTNHKVADVMYDSGFRHAETFRRAFVSRYNIDPRDVVRKQDPQKQH